MNILLLDDEPFELKLLARQLSVLGHGKVAQCVRGHEALALLNQRTDPIDLIFCDLQMPEMDGVEFLRHLGNIAYSGALVLISGEDERLLQTAQTLARAQQLQVQGLLRKPVHPHQLEQVLAARPTRPDQANRAPQVSYPADELLWAIAEGQLINYYQPKVDAASGMVVGMETLVRWQHPDDGLVLPEQFIGTALAHDLMDDLTKSVLANALAQARRWHDDDWQLQLSINIPIEHLDTLDFPDQVARMVRQAGLPMSALILEIAETGLERHSLPSLDILARLGLKHIGLSIDDFGSRHASLTQLRGIPFGELKIDRTFVHGASRDPSLNAIFLSSLELARQLSMKTVAVGVEDREDWEFVHASGCDMVQGYFIGKPMPARQIPDWLAEWDDRQRDLFAWRSLTGHGPARNM